MPDSEAAAALRERLTAAAWELRWSGAGAGADQMALDEALLDAAARGEQQPVLRFYTWDPPAVSLGRFQVPDGIRLEYARSRGWHVVRRPTGGRAVLHHLELTYAVVLPPESVGGAGVRTSYAVLCEALGVGLQALIGPASGAARRGASPRCGGTAEANCFARAAECDTLAGSRKLVGSAQARRAGALLQHGSILLDADREAWAALFGRPGDLTTLREILGAAPDLERVAAAIVSGFQAAGVEFRQ